MEIEVTEDRTFFWFYDKEGNRSEQPENNDVAEEWIKKGKAKFSVYVDSEEGPYFYNVKSVWRKIAKYDKIRIRTTKETEVITC